MEIWVISVMKADVLPGAPPQAEPGAEESSSGTKSEGWS